MAPTSNSGGLQFITSSGNFVDPPKPKSRRRLYFYGHGPQTCFRPGQNTTVRTGDKWSGTAGQEVEVWVKRPDNTERLVGYAKIDSAVDTLFDKIVQHYLNLQHNPNCTTLEGLREAMNIAYPDGWGPKVTVLVFQLTHINFG